ncbi:Rab family GTPase [Arcobacter sp. s6]|uniref:Rab family GTPase n=1 Tax=Arcobacter sp. s6 TaxID=3230363 RepID=UPI00349FE889
MFNYKIVLLGDFGTGKTSLINRYVDDSFREEYLSTIGVSISNKTIDTLINNKVYTSNTMIWDIEGKTEFKPILSHYLSGAKGFIIVVDVTRKNTINLIEEHLILCEKTEPNLPICIALNKSDSEHEEIDLINFKKLYPNIIFITKTSAKNNSNIEKLFKALSEKIIEQLL